MFRVKKLFLVTGVVMLSALAGCSFMDGMRAMDNIELEDALTENEILENGLSENEIGENMASVNGISGAEEEPENDTGTSDAEEDAGTYYTMEEVMALDIPEDMLAYWMVLNSKMPFVSWDEGNQEFYWDTYLWERGYPSSYHRGDQLAIVDMNHDNKNEIVLYCSPESAMVLHYEDGAVYGYQFIFRGICPVFENGVYIGSGGASYATFYRLNELSKDGYVEETISTADYYIDLYEIGGITVSKEEYDEFHRNLFDEVGEVEFFYYEEELLDTNLLAGLSEEELYMVKHAAVEPMHDTAEYPMAPEVMQAYYEVLTSEREFISVTDYNRMFYLDDYHYRNVEYDEDYQILYFSIVDMDRDGIYEVVLTCSYETTQILHYEDGNVYSYQFDYYDEVSAIANNGLFSIGNLFYDSSLDGYGRIISFDENGCVIEKIEFDGSINDDRIRYYYFSEELIERYFK